MTAVLLWLWMEMTHCAAVVIWYWYSYFSFSNIPSSYHNKHYGKIEYSLKVVMDKTGDIFDKKIKVLLGILNPQHCIDYPQYMVSFEKLNLAIGGRAHGCYISNKRSLLDQGHLMPRENYINLHVMLHCDFQMWWPLISSNFWIFWAGQIM